MAYTVKYRAEGKTVRQNKSIRADILLDGYTDQIAGISNGVVGYDTFTTSGTSITSAIWDGTGNPVYAESDESFSVTAGKTYIIYFTLTLNSGEAPIIDFSGVTCDQVQSASGINSIELTPSTSGTASLYIWNENATNYSTGSIIIINKAKFGSSPVIISQVPPDDPFDGGVQGSECRMALISETDFQFSEFFTCTERDYWVQIYFDGTEVWSGFIAPEMYEEPYIAPPYQIELVAYDGLGDLKNLEWTTLTPNELSFRGFIEDAIDDLDTEYANWYDYVFNATTGLEETGVSNASDADNVKFNLTRFVSDSISEYSTYYDILDAICKATNSRLIMDRGHYRWYRVPGLRDDAHYYTYWAKGAGTSNGSENNKKDITGPDAATPNCFIGGDQRLSIFPALREFNVRHDYNYRNLLFKDYSFEQTDPTDYWEAQSGFSLSTSNRVGREMELLNEKTTYEYKEIRKVNQDWQIGGRDRVVYIPTLKYQGAFKYMAGNYCLDMGSGNTTPANLLSSARVHYQETFTVQNTATANYALNVKWDQKTYFADNAKTTLYVRAYNASSDLWLQEDGTFTATVSAIEFAVSSSLQWATYEILSEELNTAYEYVIHIYLTTAATTGIGSVSGTWFDNIEVTVVRLDTDAMPMEVSLTEAISTNYNLYESFPVRFLGDIDEQGYEDTIYKGYLEAWDTGTDYVLTTQWQVAGSRSQTLLAHTRDLHKCARETPLYRLHATFYGNNNFMTVYTDANISKNFFTNYATWDLKEMTWTGEFIELPEASVETTNLITGWTNDGSNPWDTLTATDEVIDSAIETTGNIADANSNSISFDSGEEFYLTWSMTKNSGADPYVSFAGDSQTLDEDTGTATLTATSTSSGALSFMLSNTNVGNYSNVTISLYRKYGW